MHLSRPVLIAASSIAILGVVSYELFRAQTPLPEPAALILCGIGLVASAQARRYLLKKV